MNNKFVKSLGVISKLIIMPIVIVGLVAYALFLIVSAIIAMF